MIELDRLSWWRLELFRLWKLVPGAECAVSLRAQQRVKGVDLVESFHLFDAVAYLGGPFRKSSVL